jgi:L-asparagine transporter-like permease
MNWEALGAITLLTLALGAVLYLPARIWARRQVKATPTAHPKLRLTKVGALLLAAAVFLLIGGLLMNYLAPESLLGKFVATSSGRFLYLFAVIILFWIVEFALKTRGISLTKELDKEMKRPS